ncbi:MAG: acyl-CoA thioesterase [Paracoccaceae bacterium]|jgi:acyl-CoA thioesterase FadM|nr:acyl-CoA thioesterase [Paracoccaceae bacterium]
MYPLIRLVGELIKFRNRPLDLSEPHISTHRCMPWDIDPWMELNNGRTLTLYDLGRVPYFARTNAVKTLKQNKWNVTVAGVSVRYRRRITTFQKITMYSKFVGWDEKFFYTEQSIWDKNGECANQIVVRTAIVDRNGIVSPTKFAEVYEWQGDQPELPDWIQSWIKAEDTRTWPPEHSPLEKR